MGNITGGYMAKQMGVPIGRLCAAVNTNGENVYDKYIFNASIYMYQSTMDHQRGMLSS